MSIKAVVFDAFGTLVEIQERRAPYRQLLQWLAAQGRIPRPDDAAVLMSNPLGLAATLGVFHAAPPLSLLAHWENDLHAELSSVRAFHDTVPALQALREAGYRLGLCSNLALPYGAVVPSLLPFGLDLYAWSYEVGAIKPDPAIYEYVVRQLHCRPEEVLFVGDTWEADYVGPTQFGMQAVHLCRNPGRPSPGPSIQSLAEILPLLV